MSGINLYDDILTKDALEDAYKKLGNIREVGKYFGVYSAIIKKYMKFYELDFKSQVKYTCNDDFFATDTEESFYLAGFIAADGCIRDTHAGQKSLFIGLSDRDEDFLYKLKNLLSSSSPIRKYLIKNSKRNPKHNDTFTVQFAITSDKIAKDLEKFGVIPRKTKIYAIPDWIATHPLRHHFIRGYFDGDGSFYSHLSKNRMTPQFYFNLRGTDAALSTVRDIFASELKLEHANTKKKIRQNRGIGTLEYGGNGVIREIFSYLYKDATIYLDRKYEKCKEVFNYAEAKTFKDIFTKELLAEKYEKYKNVDKVAEELGATGSVILKYMRKFNLDVQESMCTKSERFKLILSKDKLKDALNNSISIKDAAKKLGVNSTTMQRYMGRNNLSKSDLNNYKTY